MPDTVAWYYANAGVVNAVGKVLLSAAVGQVTGAKLQPSLPKYVAEAVAAIIINLPRLVEALDGLGSEVIKDWVVPVLSTLSRLYTSRTPEDKFGPAGYDASGVQGSAGVRYVGSGHDFSYQIEFWNKADAEVATQDAVIMDPLDPDVFDLSTLEITRVGLLAWDLPLAGGQSLDTRIDLRPEMDLAVEIRAGLGMHVPGFANNADIDGNTLVFWFHAVDPVTGEYPEDPFAGFLPPLNPDTRYEIGWVDFTVAPVAGLPSGTQVANQAFVEFDFLGDIADHPAPKEGPWINRIDAEAPTSRAESLPEQVAGLEATISWTGQDEVEGSGLASYDVYVSDDGGEYALWLEDTMETSAVFHGQHGHKYAFYTLATDNVGHVEEWPSEPDAWTTLLDPTAPTIEAWYSAADHGNAGEGLLEIPDDESFSEPRASGLSRFVVRFSEAIDPVSFTSGSVAIAGLDAEGEEIDLSALTVSTSTREGDTVGVITFNEALPDVARYIIGITGVVDLAGNAMEGDSDRVLTALAGDISGDCQVNNTDVGRAKRLVTTDPVDVGLAEHVRRDITGDGRIDLDDVDAVRSARGQDAHLIAEPALPEAPLPAPAIEEQAGEPVAASVEALTVYIPPVMLASEASDALALTEGGTAEDAGQASSQAGAQEPALGCAAGTVKVSTTASATWDDQCGGPANLLRVTASVYGPLPATTSAQLRLSRAGQSSRLAIADRRTELLRCLPALPWPGQRSRLGPVRALWLPSLRTVNVWGDDDRDDPFDILRSYRPSVEPTAML